MADTRFFARRLESDTDKYNEPGWVEWGRDTIPSLPDDPIVLLEWQGDSRGPRVADEGRKDDTGKDRFDLLDPIHERAIVRVLTFGAKEYGDHNFKKVKDPYDRYYAALRRHLNDWRSGQKIDPKTGESHLAHVICNALFLMYFDDQKQEK